MNLKDYLEKKGIKQEEFENYIKKNIKNNKDEIIKKIEYIIDDLSKNYKIIKWVPLLKWVTSQYKNKKDFLRILKDKDAWELMLALIIIKSIYKKNYPTTIIYTSQTRDTGLGYYFPDEKPSETELLNELKRHFESIYRIQWFGNKKRRKNKMEGYLYEIRVYGELKSELKDEIENGTIDENKGFSLKRIFTFNKELINIKKNDERLTVKYPLIILFAVIDYLMIKMFMENKRPTGYDLAEIFLVNNKLTYRRYYILSNIPEIYYIFYSNKDDDFVIEKKNESEEIIHGSKLSKFLSSFLLRNEDYLDKSEYLIDHLIYYLFNYKKINGEILDKLVNLVIKYNKEVEKPKKILYIDYVLKKFWNINNMEPQEIKKWGRNAGRYIRKTYGKIYDDEKAKKIISRIIDELKVESIPGRFFDKLTRIIKDYEIPMLNIGNIMTSKEVKDNLDNFFYVKSLIIAGLLDAWQENYEAEKQSSKVNS